MCEANVFIAKANSEDLEPELYLESVDEIIPEEEENTWRLKSIFGEQKILTGKILKMSLVDHRIIFQTL
jgi:predicted RNA-binding protein